jgi:hypothetical protein
MAWNQMVEIAALCVVIAGAILSTRFSTWRGEEFYKQELHLAMTGRLESIGELWGRVIFLAGLLLLTLGSIVGELQRGASHQWLAFLLASSPLMILLCGVTLGRLSLR